MINQEDILRLLLNCPSYSLAMLGTKNESPEDQKVECALQEGNAALVSLGGHST